MLPVAPQPAGAGRRRRRHKAPSSVTPTVAPAPVPLIPPLPYAPYVETSGNGTLSVTDWGRLTSVPRQEYEARQTAQDRVLTKLAEGIDGLTKSIGELNVGIAGTFARMEEVQRNQRDDLASLQQQINDLRTQVAADAQTAHDEADKVEDEVQASVLRRYVEQHQFLSGVSLALISALLYQGANFLFTHAHLAIH